MACICAARNEGNRTALQEAEWSAIRAINGIPIIDNMENAQLGAYNTFVTRVINSVSPDLIEREGFFAIVGFVYRLGGNQQVLASQRTFNLRQLPGQLKDNEASMERI